MIYLNCGKTLTTIRKIKNYLQKNVDWVDFEPQINVDWIDFEISHVNSIEDLNVFFDEILFR